MSIDYSLQPRDWLIAISQIDGVGRKTLRTLLPHIISAHKQQQECYPAILKQIPFNHPQRKILHRTMLTAYDVLAIKERLHSTGIQTITCMDDSFPPLLTHLTDAPLVLYAVGDVERLLLPCISIVGTRNPTSHGRHIAYQFAYQLSCQGFCVCSGMARGIDAEAHRGALQGIGSTIAVLGCGIDVVYPVEHQNMYRQICEKGLVISEYRPGTRPHRAFFPERNRLISGLSAGVVVVEAAESSGSLITANLALDQGREVFAIPGSILSKYSKGTNSLIKSGAKIVTDVSDIVEEVRPQISQPICDSVKKIYRISSNERKILETIESMPLRSEQLIDQVALSLPELNEILLKLEMKGLIQRKSGLFYKT